MALSHFSQKASSAPSRRLQKFLVGAAAFVFAATATPDFSKFSVMNESSAHAYSLAPQVQNLLVAKKKNKKHVVKKVKKQNKTQKPASDPMEQRLIDSFGKDGSDIWRFLVEFKPPLEMMAKEQVVRVVVSHRAKLGDEYSAYYAKCYVYYLMCRVGRMQKSDLMPSCFSEVISLEKAYGSINPPVEAEKTVVEEKKFNWKEYLDWKGYLALGSIGIAAVLAIAYLISGLGFKKK
ncbi:MAG: hypothetical protein V1492_04735 [Candidatus Micrarchaeota archaeon]